MLTSAKFSTETRNRENKQQNQQNQFEIPQLNRDKTETYDKN